MKKIIYIRDIPVEIEDDDIFDRSGQLERAAAAYHKQKDEEKKQVENDRRRARAHIPDESSMRDRPGPNGTRARQGSMMLGNVFGVLMILVIVILMLVGIFAPVLGW